MIKVNVDTKGTICSAVDLEVGEVFIASEPGRNYTGVRVEDGCFLIQGDKVIAWTDEEMRDVRLMLAVAPRPDLVCTIDIQPRCEQ